MKNSFWLVFLPAIGGVLVGAIFTGNVETLLVSLIRTIYYRPFFALLVTILLIAALGYIHYLEKIERAQKETMLSDDARQRIRAELEHELRTKRSDIERKEQLLSTKRDRLHGFALSAYREIDLLQQNHNYFIHHIEAVAKLLQRRSQSLQKEMPENPVAVDELRQRNERLQGELRDILKDLSITFPDMSGSLPKLPDPPPPTAATTPIKPALAPGHIEILALKDELENKQRRVPEYEKKRLKKGRSI